MHTCTPRVHVKSNKQAIYKSAAAANFRVHRSQTLLQNLCNHFHAENQNESGKRNCLSSSICKFLSTSWTEGGYVFTKNQANLYLMLFNVCKKKWQNIYKIWICKYEKNEFSQNLYWNFIILWANFSGFFVGQFL